MLTGPTERWELGAVPPPPCCLSPPGRGSCGAEQGRAPNFLAAGAKGCFPEEFGAFIPGPGEVISKSLQFPQQECLLFRWPFMLMRRLRKGLPRLPRPERPRAGL